MSVPLLSVQDVSVTYPVRRGWFGRRQDLHAVNHVSFFLEQGETVGLVGESGCGKSSLGRALVALEKISAGHITIEGRDLSALKGEELRRERRKFQMIFQDPYGSLNPRLSIFAALDEVLALNGRKSLSDRRRLAAELLELVGLDGALLDRFPHQFSGGQRQRIGIARALAAEPRFIVADEPVSALDVSVQAAIINLLDKLRREKGVSFLFIAHDLAVVEHISSRILVMYLGHVVEEAPSHELTRSPRHPYTAALLSAVPVPEPTASARIVLPGDVPSPLSPPRGCPFHPRCPYAQERCRAELPELAPVPGEPGRSCRCFYPRRQFQKS